MLDQENGWDSGLLVCLSSDGGSPSARRLRCHMKIREASETWSCQGTILHPLERVWKEISCPEDLVMCVGLLLQPMQLLEETFLLLSTAFLADVQNIFIMPRNMAGGGEQRWATS